MANDHWLGMGAAAHQLGVSVRTVERTVAAGALPSYVNADGARLVWVAPVVDAPAPPWAIALRDLTGQLLALHLLRPLKSLRMIEQISKDRG